RGSTSRVYAVPLTVTVISMSGLLSTGTGGGPAQRPRGQLAGQVSLVVDRAALVGHRLAVLGGDPAGPGEALLGGRLAAQRRPGRRHRVVAHPALHLLVRGTTAGPHRHADLHQKLVRGQDGLVRADVQLAHRDGAGAGGTPDDRDGVDGRERRAQVLRRV